jgi:hypothetical protein
MDTGWRRYDEFAASGGEYNPKGFNEGKWYYFIHDPPEETDSLAHSHL